MRRSFLIDDDSTFRPAAGGAFLCRYLDRRGATDLCACRLPNVSQVVGLALRGRIDFASLRVGTQHDLLKHSMLLREGATANAQVTVGLPVLKTGSMPESGPTVVKHLQLMLNERGGHPVLVEEGVFGSTTETSVKYYQQNENLTVDGIVGKQTWTSLLSKWLLQSEPG
jgi:peptidoglycan hydrolase-like protein with peptidoglycan-binding domain